MIVFGGEARLLNALLLNLCQATDINCMTKKSPNMKLKSLEQIN